MNSALTLPRCLPDLLLPWYEENKRELPWRQDQQPYHVWLSEIMLQQTRVEAVKPYYQRFLATLPEIRDLASCDDETLLKLWEGLGYYSRARNLRKAAKMIITEYGGIFPCTYEEILKLPGIGEYTAGAIASICFDQRTPAVDGNVLRVITRLSAYYGDILDQKVKREISRALADIYPEHNSGRFTQALMELGAVVCIPRGKPECANCPLINLCNAYQQGIWEQLPVKRPKKQRTVQELTVFLLSVGGKLALRKRKEKGLLAGLWEFPNTLGALSAQEAIGQAEAWHCAPVDIQQCVHRSHCFTHIQWEMTGYVIQCREKAECFSWFDEEELIANVSVPSAFRQFLSVFSTE